jgi:hypothetical protein
MVTGAPSPGEEEAHIRSELHSLVDDVEALTRRVWELHARIPLPPGDDLMLVGEEEPVFLHVARVVLECALGDSLEPLLRDLRKVLEER